MKRGIYIGVAIIALIISLISAYIYIPLFKITTVGVLLVIVLSIIGIIIPILSLVLIKKEKMKNVFLILNIIIIIVAIFFYVTLIGFGGGIDEGMTAKVTPEILKLFKE